MMTPNSTINISIEDLVSHLEFNFTKTNDQILYSSVTEIKIELEAYLLITRALFVKIEIETLLIALDILGYKIIATQGTDYVCNVDLLTLGKFILKRLPQYDKSVEAKISDLGTFYIHYGAAMKNLIEWDPLTNSDVFNDENGMFTVFEHNNSFFKVQYQGPIIHITNHKKQ